MNSIINDKITSFNSSGIDYKVELIAAELRKQGITEDDLQFKNCSSFNRTFSKDIRNIKILDEGFKQMFELEANREGIYDMLPESIFHFSTKPKKNKTDILEEIKKNREEEKEARSFFMPFENEFYLKRLNLELQHQFFLKYDSTASNRFLFKTLYISFPNLEDSQILCLLYIVPLAHQIRADLEKSIYCLSRLIGLPVYIENSKLQLKHYKPDMHHGIGYSFLGINTILGNSIFARTKSYLITIKNIELSKLHLFFNDGPVRNFINCIIYLLLPAICDFTLILEVKPEENHAFISHSCQYSYLNFNSYI